MVMVMIMKVLMVVVMTMIVMVMVTVVVVLAAWDESAPDIGLLPLLMTETPGWLGTWSMQT